MNAACEAVGLSRATAYRRLAPRGELASRRTPRPAPARKIPEPERKKILAVLDSERFIDQPPREVYGTLLSEGTFLCSIRTMYRLLRERGPLSERRAHRERTNHPVPRLAAYSATFDHPFREDSIVVPTIRSGSERSDEQRGGQVAGRASGWGFRPFWRRTEVPRRVRR